VYVEGALSSIKFLSQQKITHWVPKSEKPYMSIKTFDKICSVFGGKLVEDKNLCTIRWKPDMGQVMTHFGQILMETKSVWAQA
jgi:hypothetical protein